MTTAIEARNLVAGYGAITIVRDLDLAVEPGEIVALLGPNGAGKTTTLHTLAGLLAPIGGQVLLHGSVAVGPLHRRVRRGLGLVTEQRSVLMRLTVADNLRVNRGDTDLALRLFPELRPHLARRAGLLSGGQQQMLALARALSRRPSVLMADELSLGLAPIVVTRLLAAVRGAADEGVAVLLVEQHLDKALDVADRAVVMHRGQIRLRGTAQEVRAGMSQVVASYLDDRDAGTAPVS